MLSWHQADTRAAQQHATELQHAARRHRAGKKPRLRQVIEQPQVQVLLAGTALPARANLALSCSQERLAIEQPKLRRPPPAAKAGRAQGISATLPPLFSPLHAHWLPPPSPVVAGCHPEEQRCPPLPLQLLPLPTTRLCCSYSRCGLCCPRHLISCRCAVCCHARRRGAATTSAAAPQTVCCAPPGYQPPHCKPLSCCDMEASHRAEGRCRAARG